MSSAASKLCPQSEPLETEAQPHFFLNWTIAPLLLLSAFVVVAGLARYAHAYNAHSAAVDSSARATRFALQVHARVQAARADRAELKGDLRAADVKRARLRLARKGGFTAAVELGGERGAAAGAGAGLRAGTRDARAQRSLVSAPGWYYAHISWPGGLPVIDSSYDVRPGAGHAYWVENGQTWKRATG